jgi:hypothetical protein
MGRFVLRLLPSIVLCIALADFASSAALANSGGSVGGGNSSLKGASSTRATTAPSAGPSTGQNKIAPARPHATPPAGVRPQTDLAAATKLIGLASGNLIKHSSLYPKMPLPPGAPALSGPIMNKIGATEGGSGSFKAVAGIPAAQLNSQVALKNGGSGGGGRAHASLSGSQAHGVGDLDGEARDNLRRSNGAGLLSWLHGLLTILGIGAIGYWMWNAAPKGARMALPAS